MKSYILKGGVVYHKCGIRQGDRGICDFTTSNEGITNITCRQCGSSTSISEFVTEVAEYYTSPDY